MVHVLHEHFNGNDHQLVDTRTKHCDQTGNTCEVQLLDEGGYPEQMTISAVLMLIMEDDGRLTVPVVHRNRHARSARRPAITHINLNIHALPQERIPTGNRDVTAGPLP